MLSMLVRTSAAVDITAGFGRNASELEFVGFGKRHSWLRLFYIMFSFFFFLVFKNVFKNGHLREVLSMCTKLHEIRHLAF